MHCVYTCMSTLYVYLYGHSMYSPVWVHYLPVPMRTVYSVDSVCWTVTAVCEPASLRPVESSSAEFVPEIYYNCNKKQEHNSKLETFWENGGVWFNENMSCNKSEYGMWQCDHPHITNLRSCQNPLLYLEFLLVFGEW